MLMRRDNVKQPRGTDTIDGNIPHLRVLTESGVLDAPVVVRVLRGGTDVETRLRPLINDQGRYVHAMPGGATIAGEYKR